MREAENVAVVRSFIEAFQRGDTDTLVETLDPAVELHEWPQGPEARTYHGHEGVRAALASWFESWERIAVEIEEIAESGDRVVVTMRQRYKGRGSELETEITSANVFSVRDSKILRVELFTDREAARVE